MPKPRQVTRPLAVLWGPRWGVLRPNGLRVAAGRVCLRPGQLGFQSADRAGVEVPGGTHPADRDEERVNLRAASTTSCGAWFPHRPQARCGLASRRAVVSIPNSSSIGSHFPTIRIGKPSTVTRFCAPISSRPSRPAGCRRMEVTPGFGQDGRCPRSGEQGHRPRRPAAVPASPQSLSEDRLWLPDFARPRASM